MARRRRARKRTALISSVVVLAMITAAWMGYRAHAAENAGDYVTGMVTKGDVDQYLDLSGSVSQANQASVGFPASGTVTSVDVALGDRVTAGEKLATMDDSQLKLAVTQAKADLASAKDEVTQAEQAADDDSSDSGSSDQASAAPSGSASARAGAGGSTSQGSTQGTGTSSGQGSGAVAGSQGARSQGNGTQGNSTQGNGSQGNGSQGSTQGTGSHGSGSHSSGNGGPSTPGSGGKAGGTTGGAGTQSQLKQLQDKVTQDTKQLTALQSMVTSAVSDQTTQCSFLDSTTSASPPSSSSPSPSSSPTDSSSPTEAPTSASPTAPESSSAATPTSTPSSATPSPTGSASDAAAPSSATPTDDAEQTTAGQDADFVIGSGSVEAVDSPTVSHKQLQDCIDAMTKVQSAQQSVTAQQQSIAADTAALTAALKEAAKAPTSTGDTTGSQSTSSPTSATSPSVGSAGASKSSGQQSAYQCTTTGQGSNSSTASNSGEVSGNTGQSSSASNGFQQSGGSGGSVSFGGSASSASSDANGSSGTGAASGSATNLSGSQGSTTTVAEAKAAVTTAKINLKLAEQKLDDATITSPIDGTVASLDFAKGDSVSTSDKIVITGHDAMAITVDVPGTKLDSVKQGQQATIGTNNSAGEVSSIGLLPASDSSSSDASYPVTITVADPGPDLAAGSTAMAHILISRATDVVQVPISAVTQNGSTGIVTVLKGNEPQRTQVKLGAVGSTTVQITSGLSVGESVVIADRSAALPSSNSSSTRFGGAGIGGAIVGQRAGQGQAGPPGSGTGGR